MIVGDVEVGATYSVRGKQYRRIGMSTSFDLEANRAIAHDPLCEVDKPAPDGGRRNPMPEYR